MAVAQTPEERKFPFITKEFCGETENSSYMDSQNISRIELPETVFSGSVPRLSTYLTTKKSDNHVSEIDMYGIFKSSSDL